jgi:uncharacterized protein YndB with AHSA1/START domain
MIQEIQSIEDLTLTITQEIHVKASLEIAFESILEEIGPNNEGPNHTPMPMKVEAWPGGRWYRDLGNNNGHYWATVQAIKRPTLLEFSGPLFASTPFLSNVQYRLTEKDGGTLISFRHTGFGSLPPEQKTGVNRGWAAMLDRISKRAEGLSSK